MASSNHLFLKGRTYYFRIAIPADLRARLGRSELRHSLGTGYSGPAQVKAKRLAVAAHDLFKDCRRGLFDDMPNEALNQAIESIFRQLLTDNEKAAYLRIGDYPKSLDYKPGTTENVIEFIQTLLREKRYDEMSMAAILFFHDLKLPIPGEPAELLEASHEIFKHFLHYYNILKHRNDGDYAYEKTIYPPQPEIIPAEKAPEQTVSAESEIALSAVLKEYQDDQVASGSWTTRSAYDMMSTLNYLTDILGDVHIGSIDFATMRDFKKTLRQLPPNRTKKKEYRDKSIQEILKMKPSKTISRTTFNNIITNTSSFFNWCVHHGYLEKNFAQGLKERVRDREDEARAIFSQQDLQALFSADEYRKGSFKQPWKFWVPLLCLYTGARREEICQLYTDDIKEVDGVWVLDINDNPNAKGQPDKKLKNLHSKRLVPIHPTLINLGFLDYWNTVKKSRKERIFPQLKKTKEKYGEYVGKWFHDFRHSVGLTSAKHDLHSFRHTFIDYAEKNDVPEKLYVEVTGHKKKGIPRRVYTKRTSPAILYEKVILKHDYGIDLTHLIENKHR